MADIGQSGQHRRLLFASVVRFTAHLNPALPKVLRNDQKGDCGRVIVCNQYRYFNQLPVIAIENLFLNMCRHSEWQQPQHWLAKWKRRQWPKHDQQCRPAD